MEIRKKFHDERMDGKVKATQKGSFIEAHFTIGKSASLFARTRQASDSTFGKLKLFPKTFQLPFKEQDSKRACKGVEEKDEGRFDTAVSTSLPRDSTFDDSPVSNALDLTSPSLYSTMVISKWF